MVANHHHRIGQPHSEYGAVAGLPVEKDLESGKVYCAIINFVVNHILLTLSMSQSNESMLQMIGSGGGPGGKPNRENLS